MSEVDFKIKTILVENDESAQLAVRKLISGYSQIDLVKVLSSNDEAIQFLNQNSVDLLLLAVNLPEINAFELLDQLDTPYPVIFVTSDIKQAFHSFDYNVIDFLEKPVHPIYFDRAVNRALERLSSNNCDQSQERGCPLKLNLLNGECDMPVDIDLILFIQSWGNYVKLYMENETRIVSLSTQKLLEILPSSQFVRVHRSFIVNRFRVDSCSYKELIVGCTTIPIGISFRQSIKEKLVCGT